MPFSLSEIRKIRGANEFTESLSMSRVSFHRDDKRGKAVTEIDRWRRENR